MIIAELILISIMIAVSLFLLIYILKEKLSSNHLVLQFSHLSIGLIFSIISGILIFLFYFIPEFHKTYICYLIAFSLIMEYGYVGLFFSKFEKAFKNIVYKKVYMYTYDICIFLIMFFFAITMIQLSPNQLVEVSNSLIIIYYITSLSELKIFLIVPFSGMTIVNLVLFSRFEYIKTTPKIIFLFLVLLSVVFGLIFFINIIYEFLFLLMFFFVDCYMILLVKNVIFEKGRYIK
jgi:hypothetical protein